MHRLTFVDGVVSMQARRCAHVNSLPSAPQPFAPSSNSIFFSFESASLRLVTSAACCSYDRVWVRV